MPGTSSPFSFNYAVIQLDNRGQPVRGYPMSKEFGQFLTTALLTPVNNASQLVGSVRKTQQQASIGVTAIPTSALSAGIYRISYYARITQAATTSSSLQVSLGWNDGVALTKVFPALMTNTPLTYDLQSIPVDIAAGPLTYAVTYSSTGATPMLFRLTVFAEVL